jgi:hypothetical protein
MGKTSKEELVIGILGQPNQDSLMGISGNWEAGASILEEPHKKSW